MQLRPYQLDAKVNVYKAWCDGAINVLIVLPTGAGKTVIFSEILQEHQGASCAIAHRQELVSQISLALARNKVRHKIIGPSSIVKLCVNIHMSELGISYYDPNAKCAVAGVDTLVRRKNELSIWLKSVTLWVLDEGHHLTKDNKWGIAANMFPNAKGLGVTATPLRADGKGLGRHADGSYDVMIEGPGGRDLIKMGYLTDYRIFAPPSDIDLNNVNISATTGDFNPQKLKTAIRKSHVVGDVVTHYLKIAAGKLGVTFASDVNTATDIAGQYNSANVPAEVVSAKTSTIDRIAILRRFKKRDLLQLVNVDLFGEGFDLPAIEVVSMARPTQSYALFVQQFGRGLRLMIDDKLNLHWDDYSDKQRCNYIIASKKSHATIIDHVGNVERHGLPDAHRIWTLDRKDKRNSNTNITTVKSCPSCTAVYDRIYKVCPFCGYKPVPTGRSSPEQVDGDLIELDALTLAKMRGEIEKVDMDKETYRIELQSKYVPEIGQHACVKRHVQRQKAQKALRYSIAWLGGYYRALGYDDSEIYRRFFFKYGIDIMTAQTLKTVEALKLADRINNEFVSMGN